MKQFDNSKGSDTVCLIYDRECPVCRHLAEKYQAANDGVQIINARESSESLDRITRKGLDINKGIVVVDEDEYYFAEAAIQRLAKTKRLRGLLGVVGRLCRYSLFVKLLYPPLTFCRKILLNILGVSLIRQHGLSEKGSAKTKNW